jgi:hypothetical protein
MTEVQSRTFLTAYSSLLQEPYFSSANDCKEQYDKVVEDLPGWSRSHKIIFENAVQLLPIGRGFLNKHFQSHASISNFIYKHLFYKFDNNIPEVIGWALNSLYTVYGPFVEGKSLKKGSQSRDAHLLSRTLRIFNIFTNINNHNWIKSIESVLQEKLVSMHQVPHLQLYLNLECKSNVCDVVGVIPGLSVSLPDSFNHENFFSFKKKDNPRILPVRIKEGKNITATEREEISEETLPTTLSTTQANSFAALAEQEDRHTICRDGNCAHESCMEQSLSKKYKFVFLNCTY